MTPLLDAVRGRGSIRLRKFTIEHRFFERAGRTPRFGERLVVLSYKHIAGGPFDPVDTVLRLPCQDLSPVLALVELAQDAML